MLNGHHGAFAGQARLTAPPGEGPGGWDGETLRLGGGGGRYEAHTFLLAGQFIRLLAAATDVLILHPWHTLQPKALPWVLGRLERWGDDYPRQPWEEELAF